jgi:hypothetical protein
MTMPDLVGDNHFVVLAAREPDVHTVLAAAGAVPELWVRLSRDDTVLQFCAVDRDRADPAPGTPVLETPVLETPVLCVESPVLVPVPGEVARLLGAGAARSAPSPLWWVEVRSTAGLAGSAHRLARELADRTGGQVWPPSTVESSDA